MSTAAGTRWRRRVVDLCQEVGFLTAESRALAGAKDKGDIVGVEDLVLETKSEKGIQLAAGVDEATIEAANAGAKYFVAVWRRRQRNVRDGYAVTRLANYLALYRELLDLRSEVARLRLVLDALKALGLGELVRAQEDLGAQAPEQGETADVA